MTIEFGCSHCGSVLRVGDEHANKKARCPQCKMILNVPGDQVESIVPETTVTPGANSPVSGEQLSMKTPDGEIYGPVNMEEMREWVAEGRVSIDCQLRSGADGNWRPAAEFFPQLSSFQTGQAQQASPFAAPVYSRPHTPVAQQPRYGPRPSNAGLILAFGILGAFFGPFGIVAWIMGANELGAINRGEVDRSNEGLARTGMVLGIIFTVLWGIFTFGCCCMTGI